MELLMPDELMLACSVPVELPVRVCPLLPLPATPEIVTLIGV